VSERRQQPSDDPLDALLAEARWPEPSAGASRRVEAVWDAISPARSRMTIRPWLWAAAAACVALVTAGLLTAAHTRRHARPTVARVTPAIAPPRAVPITTEPYPSRPPNPWELAAMRDAERAQSAQAQPPKPEVATEAPPQPLAPVPPADSGGRQQWLARALSEARVDLYLKYVRDPATRDDALAATERVQHPPLNQLLDALDDPHEDVRLAAARVLGRIDGPVTTAALVRRVNDPAIRREVLAALMFSDGPEAATFLRAARGDPRLAAQVHSLELQRSALQ
jgi:hypothetical protein